MKITIKERNYIGVIIRGSILENSITVELNKNYANIEWKLEICLDPNSIQNQTKPAEISIRVPMIMTDEEITNLNKVLEKISKGTDFIYQEQHYSNDRIDPQKYEYTDIIIDDNKYEIDNNNEILQELSNSLKLEKISKIIFSLYDDLTKE